MRVSKRVGEPNGICMATWKTRLGQTKVKVTHSDQETNRKVVASESLLDWSSVVLPWYSNF